MDNLNKTETSDHKKGAIELFLLKYKSVHQFNYMIVAANILDSL